MDITAITNAQSAARIDVAIAISQKKIPRVGLDLNFPAKNNGAAIVTSITHSMRRIRR